MSKTIKRDKYEAQKKYGKDSKVKNFTQKNNKQKSFQRVKKGS